MLAALSFVTVVVSVLLLAWQSSELARQSKLQTRLAGTASLGEAVNGLHNVLAYFLQYPELRPYFEGQMLDELVAADTRIRVLVVAEMLADRVEATLDIRREHPWLEKRLLEGWGDYADFLLAQSPALREYVASSLQWYPRLAECYEAGRWRDRGAA